jgi:riboflavin synthase
VFTGLVEEVGTVRAVTRGAGAVIRVSAPVVIAGTQIGDSISVNGVCLTVTKIGNGELSFDAVEETLARSSLGSLRAGDKVNLERSVSAERLFGGHFVLGHVDGTGIITRFEKHSGSAVLAIRASDDVMRYVVSKGSIAVDGISLTVASVSSDEFSIAVIPHTIESTTLASKRPGDVVNLEADIIGKYVEKFLSARTSGNGVTARFLADAGFIEE